MSEHLKKAITITAALLGLAFIYSVSLGQDQEEEAGEFWPGVPTHIEYIDGDVVISKIGKDRYVITDEGVHEKLDAIIDQLGIVVGPDERPNLNTISEQELFGLMSTAKIYRARSMAALIWSHIHDGGNTITTKQELIDDILGVGEKTADALWPLVSVEEAAGD